MTLDNSNVIALRSPRKINGYSESLLNSFNQFWQIYPRRIGKGYARKAFLSASKIEDLSIIIQAAEEFAHIMKGTDPQYIPHPSTWLNGERWDDDLSAYRSPTTTDILNDIVGWDNNILSLPDE